LTETTWRFIKTVDTEGNETEFFDHLVYSIDGSDSTCIRISDNPSLMVDVNLTTRDTVSIEWSWAYALNGK